MKKLVYEKVGFAGSGACADIDDVCITEHRFLLLVVEPVKFVAGGAAYILHSQGIRKDTSCQVYESDEHAVVRDERLPVHLLVLVDHVVQPVLERKGSVRHLGILTPFVELLQGIGESAVCSCYLRIEVMRDRPDGL